MPHPACYSITFGLTGCYMPNSDPYAIFYTTRHRFAAPVQERIFPC